MEKLSGAFCLFPTLSKVVSILGGICSRFQFALHTPSTPTAWDGSGIDAASHHSGRAPHDSLSKGEVDATQLLGRNELLPPLPRRDETCVLGFSIFHMRRRPGSGCVPVTGARTAASFGADEG